jgi:tetratricopeptide (TPR) repeat protein
MPRSRDRIAQWLVAGVLVVAAFAIGGSDRWVIIGCAALAAVAAGTALTSQREMVQPSPLLVFLGLAAALTLLQIIPLPALLIAHLSPGKYALVVDNARALGEDPPSWIALSLDPPATLLELTKLAGYVALAYTCLRLSGSPRGRRWIASVVALVGIAMAVAAIGHRVVGAETVFGIYAPHQKQASSFVAPLLNQNHLAALMALCAPIAIGLALTDTGRARIGWSAGALACVTVGLLAESREGAFAMLVGLFAIGVLALAQRGAGSRQMSAIRRSDAIAIGIAVVSALVLLGVLTAGGLAREFAATNLGEIHRTDSKFAAWRSGAPFLDDYPWLGIGRGAFEVASTSAVDSHAYQFTHVENEYLQAAVDWGFLGAGILSLAFVWLATTAARKGRAGLFEAGVLAGVVALAVENLADFSLWMPGVAYAAIAALATVTYVPVEAQPRRSRTLYRPVRIGGLVAIAVVIAFAASPKGRLARDEATVAAAGGTAHGDVAAAVAHAREIFARHPADYVSAAMTANALFLARDQRAVAVANRALALHPTSSELHRLVARMLLASRHRDQAKVEYALALRYAPTPAILQEVLDVFPRDEDAVRALPLIANMVVSWSNELRQRGRAALALAYIERYLAVNPDDVTVLLYGAGSAFDANDLVHATDWAERAFALQPTGKAAIELARCRAAAGRTDLAITLLRDTVDRPPRPQTRRERADLLVALADTQARAGQLEPARASLLTALEHADREGSAAIHRKLAEIEASLGNEHQADWARKRAEELDR